MRGSTEKFIDWPRNSYGIQSKEDTFFNIVPLVIHSFPSSVLQCLDPVDRKVINNRYEVSSSTYVSGGVGSVMVTVVENGHSDKSSNLNEAVYNSHCAKTLGKGMNPTILLPAIDSKSHLFFLTWVWQPIKEKESWIQIC